MSHSTKSAPQDHTQPDTLCQEKPHDTVRKVLILHPIRTTVCTL